MIGRKFTVISDHKPLKFLFDPKKEIPKFTSARIQRWAIELMGLDFDILHCRGVKNLQADALSRLKFQDEPSNDLISMYGHELNHILHWENNCVSLNDIREETARDNFLQRIIRRVVLNDWTKCSVKEAAYKKHRQILCIEDDILLKGTVPVIPEVLRRKVMQSAHATHGGVMATNLLLKQEAWWPRFSIDVERMVRECPVCCEIKTQVPTAQDK